jgi:hypothetical protein
MLLCYLAFCFGASVSVVLLLGQLSQSIEVCNLAFKFANGVDEGLQARYFFDLGLGAFPVAPEIGRGHSRFERAQFLLQPADLKETSAARQRVSLDLVHQLSQSR